MISRRGKAHLASTDPTPRNAQQRRNKKPRRVGIRPCDCNHVLESVVHRSVVQVKAEGSITNFSGEEDAPPVGVSGYGYRPKAVLVSAKHCQIISRQVNLRVSEKPLL